MSVIRGSLKCLRASCSVCLICFCCFLQQPWQISGLQSLCVLSGWFELLPSGVCVLLHLPSLGFDNCLWITDTTKPMSDWRFELNKPMWPDSKLSLLFCSICWIFTIKTTPTESHTQKNLVSWCTPEFISIQLDPMNPGWHVVAWHMGYQDWFKQIQLRTPSGVFHQYHGYFIFFIMS